VPVSIGLAALVAMTMLAAPGCTRRAGIPEPITQQRWSVVTPAMLRDAGEAAASDPAETALFDDAVFAILDARARDGSKGTSWRLACEALLLAGDDAGHQERLRGVSLRLLQDERREVRYHALRALRTDLTDPGVRAVIEALRADPDPLISGEARLILS